MSYLIFELVLVYVVSIFLSRWADFKLSTSTPVDPFMWFFPAVNTFMGILGLLFILSGFGSDKISSKIEWKSKFTKWFFLNEKEDTK